MSIYFSSKELLGPPTERAAFSDRQAYVCAELARLAYFKFEGGHTLDEALQIVRDILPADERRALLEQQLRVVLSSSPSTAVEGEQALARILEGAGFALAQTFSNEGTQAFLCTRRIKHGSGAHKTIGWLVFRGTEPKDFHDIRSDVRASLTAVTIDGESFELHSGYLDAFNIVRADIEQALDAALADQLIVTGHSLGGALAIVTTRLLKPDSTGACYTFGAPPVGTVAVQNRLKTPVYEIINELDIVPRLPNPWLTTGFVVLLRIARLLAKGFTLIEKALATGTWDEKLERFMQSMTRYRHPGYVSYLVGNGTAARLRYNVGNFDRLKWWLSMTWKRRIWLFGRMVGDHSIELYSSRLRTHALRRL